jgi:putative nucleotidyltransferase with HDIG domain
MKEAIQEYFKWELAWIKDQDMREKTVLAWEIALKESEFGPEDLERLPFTLFERRALTTLGNHVKLVTEISYKAALAMNEALFEEKDHLDIDHVVCGALLHDVGKVLEYTRLEDGTIVKGRKGRLLRHPITGAQIARDAGLPDHIQHMIWVHSKEGNGQYRTPEAYVVLHADFMTFDVLE